ncbi:hypothetical protein GGP85_003271 [Salinibacter ruber]|uniref:hypothetical protein n=1 Tax=Salinibacter ruber TaxID=146919 RepID=UPI00216A1E0F|nr:hypothetical protein [Salinibacter ruber]MCS3827800.1 hypothetical protein [Salinibacter ruber]
MPSFSDIDWGKINTGGASVSPETIRKSLQSSNSASSPPELPNELVSIAKQFVAGFEKKALRAYKKHEPTDEIDATLQDLFARIERGDLGEKGVDLASRLRKKMSAIEDALDSDSRFAPWRGQSLEAPVDLTSFHEVDQPDRLGQSFKDLFRADLQNQITEFGFDGVDISGDIIEGGVIPQNRWSHLNFDVTEISCKKEQDETWLGLQSDEIQVNLNVISSVGHEFVNVSPMKRNIDKGESRQMDSRYSEVEVELTDSFPQRYEVLVSMYEIDWGPLGVKFVRKLFKKLKPVVEKFVKKAKKAIEKKIGSSDLADVAGWLMRKIWGLLHGVITGLVGNDPIGHWKHSFTIYNLSGNWASTDSPTLPKSFKLFGSGAVYKVWFEAKLL